MASLRWITTILAVGTQMGPRVVEDGSHQRHLGMQDPLQALPHHHNQHGLLLLKHKQKDHHGKHRHPPGNRDPRHQDLLMNILLLVPHNISQKVKAITVIAAVDPYLQLTIVPALRGAISQIQTCIVAKMMTVMHFPQV